MDPKNTKFCPICTEDEIYYCSCDSSSDYTFFSISKSMESNLSSTETKLVECQEQPTSRFINWKFIVLMFCFIILILLFGFIFWNCFHPPGDVYNHNVNNFNTNISINNTTKVDVTINLSINIDGSTILPDTANSTILPDIHNSTILPDSGASTNEHDDIWNPV